MEVGCGECNIRGASELLSPRNYLGNPERWSITFQPEEKTETAMLNTIMDALLPMVVTFVLGFVAAWRHDFGSMEASTLNRMVLPYVLPLLLSHEQKASAASYARCQSSGLPAGLLFPCHRRGTSGLTPLFHQQPRLNKQHWEK
jgi:hypothetical protein